jgi:TolA-binding protein
VALYPNSERNDVAYDYLVKVYMSTSNYRDAMTSIENIKTKSLSVKKAYQRVAYFRAMECFNNLDYTNAIEIFNKSIEAGDFNKNYHLLSKFWRAEAYYRTNDFNKAINEYSSFLKTPGAFSIPEFRAAHYNIAYAYFQLNDYPSAADFFRKYLNMEADLRSERVADANNRLGDCYFLNRDYSQAVASYDKSLHMSIYDADYSLFQKAFCQGLMREYQLKLNSLQSLIQVYPNSSYQDDALFELGKTCERLNQTHPAIGYYNDVLNKFPQSSFAGKALVQLGLAYYNLGDYQSSVNAYKQVVEKMPNSSEMVAALAGMKNSYLEMNDVDAYFAYTNKLGAGITVSVTEQDSLSYQSAEKLYMSRDNKAKAQFERYLNQFPNGSFSLNARFYLSEIFYAQGEFDQALSGYEFVLAQPDHSFTEASLSKAAKLNYNNSTYSKALSYFERLAKISDTGNNLLDARTGVMRCHYKMANYQSCIEVANQILGSEKVSEILKRETNYKLALSLYNLGNRDKSFPLLKQLAGDTNSAEGAEAKFLVSLILFEKQKLKDAEAEIMDFIDKNSPHQFWLAKSFILLSDIYLKNGDEFQAKHTLKSIEENYPEKTDGILDTTLQKLQVIESKEASQTGNQNKPLEINLKGKK